MKLISKTFRGEENNQHATFLGPDKPLIEGDPKGAGILGAATRGVEFRCKQFPVNVLTRAIRSAIGPIEMEKDSLGQTRLRNAEGLLASGGKPCKTKRFDTGKNVIFIEQRANTVLKSIHMKKRPIMVYHFHPAHGKEIFIGPDNKKPLAVVLPGAGPWGAEARVPSRLAVLLSGLGINTLVMHNLEAEWLKKRGDYWVDPVSQEEKADLMFDQIVSGIELGIYDPKRIAVYSHSAGHETALRILDLIKKYNLTKGKAEKINASFFSVNPFLNADMRNWYYQYGRRLKGRPFAGLSLINYSPQDAGDEPKNRQVVFRKLANILGIRGMRMLADEEYRFPPNVNHLIATARYDECRMMVKPDSKNMGTKHYKVIPSRHYEESNYDFTEAEREEAKKKLLEAKGGPIPFQKHDAHRFRRLTEMTMLLEMAAEFAYKNLRENHG